MPQPKDKDWLNGYKNKTPIYAVYKRHKPRDTYGLKVKGWKKIFHTNGEQKKAGVAILTSDKIDFVYFIDNKNRNKSCERGQKKTLHNNQRINPRRRYNNYKYMHPT